MKSYPKINVFLKIIGTRENYHELISRFILIDNIYDEITFIQKECETLEIICNKDIGKVNTLTKAYNELENIGFKKELDNFFKTHAVKLEKNTPIGGGIGGGSSNGATFLKLLNEELNLNISQKKLLDISKNIGADLPFFVSGYKSANVSGIGEIIEEFNDIIPKINLDIKPIFCDTSKVYKEYRNNFIQTIDKDLSKELATLNSQDILKNYKNNILNDLLNPCLKLYPNLIINDNEFLSGSGSTCFYLGE